MKIRWRKWMGRVLYVLFLLLLVESALQAYYWITAGQPLWERTARPTYAPDPVTVFWNKKNLSLRHKTNEFDIEIHTNADGLRVPTGGERYAPGPHPGLYRIVLMGPSFAFGWGVDYPQTFAAQLQDMLQRGHFAGDRQVQVVDAGVPAMGADGNLRWFEARGKDLEPDLVVQFIYGSMVVVPTKWEDLGVDDEGYLVIKNAPTSLRVRTAAKNSAIVFYGWTLWTRFRPSGEIEGAGRQMEATPAATAASHAYFEALRAAVQKAGAALLVVHFPLSYGIHRQDLARWRHLGVVDVDQERATNARLCATLDARGVPCLNITPELAAEAAKGKRLYFWLDIHWTPEGNRVAARAVADHLLRSPQP